MGFHWLFVDSPAAIGEERQSIEHKEQYGPSKKFQFGAETKWMQGREQKPTYRTFRGNEQ